MKYNNDDEPNPPVWFNGNQHGCMLLIVMKKWIIHKSYPYMVSCVLVFYKLHIYAHTNMLVVLEPDITY